MDFSTDIFTVRFWVGGEVGDMYFRVDSNHDAISASSINLDVATGDAMIRISQNK